MDKNTEVTKLKAYVSNRVRVIQQLTDRWRWLYVNTQENPADFISRGLGPRDISCCSMWWDGPAFLHCREYSCDSIVQLPDEIPEKKPDSTQNKIVALTTKTHNDIFEYLQKYSDLNKMIRVTAYVLRFCSNLRTRDK